MLFIKVMSSQVVEDSDEYKDFVIYTVGERDRFKFERMNGEVFLLIWRGIGELPEEYQMHGNAYVMNAQGKTIASYRCANIYKRVTNPDFPEEFDSRGIDHRIKSIA